MPLIGMLGVGAMGQSILTGLLRAGWSPQSLRAAARRPEVAAEFTTGYGIQLQDPAVLAHECEVVFLAMKPQDVAAALAHIGPHLRPGTLVVSLAGGLTTGQLESALPTGTAVVRAMPNTPALVGQAMTVLSPGANCRPAQLGQAQELLAACGQTMVVPEGQHDAVAAVSGSGPAYILYVVEAMIEAGVMLGLARPAATELVTQTLLGTAIMLNETGQHPSLLREQVASPAGTTIAALHELDDHRVRAAFVTAMIAARDRSREIASSQSPAVPQSLPNSP